MDINLLRSWVGLPPGPWPPPDRELLGLPADGPLDPASVETAALDRMARLRTHQLLHPDLVTEGMNRVAQAMMTAATGHAPRRPKAPPLPPVEDYPALDDFPPIAPVPDVPAVAAPAQFEQIPSFAPPPPPAIDLVLDLTAPAPVVPAAPAPPAPGPRPKVLEAVPVATPPPAEPPVAVVAPVPAFRRPPVEPIRIPENVPPPPGLALDEGEVPPHARRSAYRELAGLRAVQRAFDKLRLSVALPGEGLLTPAAVCDLLEAVAEFRDAVAHPGLSRGFARTVAPNLFTVLSHPLPLALFRSLTRTQRLELAREWAGGRAGVLARHEALRAGLERPRRADPGANFRRWAADTFADRPELLLFAASVLLGLVAVVRTAAR